LQSLIAFAAVEGFSSQELLFYLLVEKRGLMPGLFF
jgi:hypothetical protein